MKNPLGKTPFLFLLIPLILGIILQYYLHLEYLSIAFFATGIIAMLGSYLIGEKYQFRFRWLFGAGICFFLTGIATESTLLRQNKSEYTFADEYKAYKGIITDSNVGATLRARFMDSCTRLMF